MKSADIIQKARDAAALEQFDSESFREGLEIAAEAVDANKLRTEHGKKFLEFMYVNQLANRLRIADYARKHPEVLQKPITKPVIIMGLPRTGTTLASYLLGADPARRSLLRWEVASPVPPPKTANLKDDPRLLAMLEQEKKSHANGPSPFDAIHYEAWDGPTECTFVLAHDFKSLFVESMSASPIYGKYILECDTTSAYQYHRLFLQVLQSEAPGIWSLKLPSHALNIRAVMKTYPDARIIWTHRDPYKATASLMNLIATAEMLSLERPDLDHVSTYYPVQMREHVRRPMAVQDESKSDPFYHLFYGDLVRDPIGQMKKLYAWLGDSFTPDVEANMKNWLRNNPQGKFGKHDYGLEKFGVSVDKLKPYFEDYLKRFDIEPEG